MKICFIASSFLLSHSFTQFCIHPHTVGRYCVIFFVFIKDVFLSFSNGFQMTTSDQIKGLCLNFAWFSPQLYLLDLMGGGGVIHVCLFYICYNKMDFHNHICRFLMVKVGLLLLLLLL